MRVIIKQLRSFLLIPVCLLAISSYAQQQDIDSLEQLLATSSIAKEQADLLNELAWQSRNINAEKGIGYAKRARDLASAEGLDAALGDSYVRLGVLYRLNSSFYRALGALDSALTIRTTLGDSTGMAHCHHNVGRTFTDMGRYDRAIEANLKSVRMKQALRDTIGSIKSYRNIGALYDRMEDYLQSIEQYEIALNLLRLQPNDRELASVRYALAIAHYRLDNLTQSRELLNQSLAFWVSTGDSTRLSQVYNQYGLLSEEEGDAQSAADWYAQSQALDQHFQNWDGVARTMVNRGRLLQATNKLANAEAVLLEGQIIARQLKDIQLQNDFALELYRLNLNKPDYRAALEFLQLHTELNDSILSEARMRSAERMSTEDAERELLSAQVQIEHARLGESKAREAELQTALEQNLLIAFGMLLIVAIGLWFYWLRARTLARNMAQEKTIASLEARSANALLEGQEQERKRIAQDLHDRVGSILSTVKHNFEALQALGGRVTTVANKQSEQFATTVTLLDEAVKELRRISHNMVSGVLTRFGLVPAVRDLAVTIESAGRLSVNVITMGLEERLDGTVEVAVFRIVQELFTNIIRHANATKATVKLEQRDNHLYVLVFDNGIGFDKDKVQRDSGMGLANVRHRVEHLDGTFDIEATKGKGVRVKIGIPLKGHEGAE